MTPQAILNFEDFNSDKSVLRMTTDRVLNSNALQKEVQLPIGVIVNLYGELLTREGVVAVSGGFLRAKGDSAVQGLPVIG